MADIRVDKKYAGIREAHGGKHASANGYVGHWFFLRERQFLAAQIETGFTLDIACGSGLMLNQLPHLPHVVGVDFNESACKQARWNQFSIVRGDAFELPFRPNTFDNVVNCQFFNQQTPLQRRPFFAEVNRVLKPGGKCHILWRGATTLIHRSAHRVFRFVDTLKGAEQFPQYAHSPTELIEMAANFNLRAMDSCTTLPFGPAAVKNHNPLAQIIGASHYLQLEKVSDD